MENGRRWSFIREVVHVGFYCILLVYYIIFSCSGDNRIIHVISSELGQHVYLTSTSPWVFNNAIMELKVLMNGIISACQYFDTR